MYFNLINLPVDYLVSAHFSAQHPKFAALYQQPPLVQLHYHVSLNIHRPVSVKYLMKSLFFILNYLAIGLIVVAFEFIERKKDSMANNSNRIYRIMCSISSVGNWNTFFQMLLKKTNRYNEIDHQYFFTFSVQTFGYFCFCHWKMLVIYFAIIYSCAINQIITLVNLITTQFPLIFHLQLIVDWIEPHLFYLFESKFLTFVPVLSSFSQWNSKLSFLSLTFIRQTNAIRRRKNVWKTKIPC